MTDADKDNPVGTSRSSSFTARAFLLGMILIACNNVWATYSEYYMRSSNVGTGVVPMSVFLPFILIACFFNIILKAISPKWALSREELLIIFIMSMVGNAANVVNWLVSLIATPYYFANSENQWVSYFHAYLPKWLLPSNENNEMQWFYDGLPAGRTIPWGVWIEPLFWWVSFVAVALFTSICLSTMLRKQWVEHERLEFPLLRVPVEIVQESEESSILPALMKNRLFWIGFGISLMMVLWTIMGHFDPTLPGINIIKHKWRRLLRSFPWVYQRLNPYVIGFSFFCNVEILFSIWFFYLLAMIQIYIYRRTGFSIGPPTEFSGEWRLVRLQGCGGYLFIAVWSMWLARKHIAKVVRKAFTNDPNIDDSEELLSYRTTVFGFIIGLTYVVIWLHRAGMDYYVIFFYLTITFLFAVGFAKMVSESGLVYFGWPFDAQEFTAFTVGYQSISPSSLTTLEVTHGRPVFNIMEFSHAAKLIDFVRVNRRALTATVAIAFLFGVVISLWFAIRMGYAYGAYNSTHWAYVRGNLWVYDSIVRKLKDPSAIDWAKMSLVGIGATITALITFLRYRLPWFRLHPIGFTVAVQWPTRISVMSIFIVWFFKAIFLRTGGVRMARRAQPLFVGILCGFAVGVMISFVVDVIAFPMHGHLVHY